MIELLCENHQGSNNNCIIVTLKYLKLLQGMTNNVRITFSVGDTTWVVYN